jgi:hypothetical protein
MTIWPGTGLTTSSSGEKLSLWLLADCLTPAGNPGCRPGFVPLASGRLCPNPVTGILVTGCDLG